MNILMIFYKSDMTFLCNFLKIRTCLRKHNQIIENIIFQI